MILLTEKPNENKNAESVFEHRYIKNGEAVGIYLHKFYTSTEKLIAQLLYHKHPVTLKYKDKMYILNTIDEWRCRVQNPKDQIQEITVKHPMKLIFDEVKAEYIEKQKDLALRKEISKHQTDDSDEEVHSLLRAFAPLYQLDVDYTDRLSVLRAYEQINFYLENDIEYANEVPGISPIGTPFENMFRDTIPDNGIEEISVGNMELLEDLHYKCKHNTVLVDDIISAMV